MSPGSCLVAALLSALSLSQVSAQSAASHEYPAMAPLEQYELPSAAFEVALARSAAPSAISGAAEILVVTPHGYVVGAPGENGFVCLVERSWNSVLDDPEF